MEVICNAVKELLSEAGFTVQQTMPPEPVQRLRAPLVTVTMQRWNLEGRPVYLGLWEPELEVYGHKCCGTLEVVVHSPKADGGQAAANMAAQAVSALMGGIEGLTLKQVECGKATFQGTLDLFDCTITAQVEAWLYAVPRDDGLWFEDFVLRGHPFHR